MSDKTGNEHKRGELAEEILNRIVADPDFRQQLLSNPTETLAEAGYLEGDDVSGYSLHRLGAVAALGTRADQVDQTTAISCPPCLPQGTRHLGCGTTDPADVAPKPNLSNHPLPKK